MTWIKRTLAATLDYSRGTRQGSFFFLLPTTQFILVRHFLAFLHLHWPCRLVRLRIAAVSLSAPFSSDVHRLSVILYLLFLCSFPTPFLLYTSISYLMFFPFPSYIMLLLSTFFTVLFSFYCRSVSSYK